VAHRLSGPLFLAYKKKLNIFKDMKYTEKIVIVGAGEQV